MIFVIIEGFSGTIIFIIDRKYIVSETRYMTQLVTSM